MTEKRKIHFYEPVILILAMLFFVLPILFVVINSFKKKLYITDQPFTLPFGDMFAGLSNYIDGIEKTGFFSAFGYSLFITVFSVLGIILFSSMCAWFIVRVKEWYTTALYYIFVFSMIVPFQMMMFTISKEADMLSLDNPVGMVFLYIGCGAGMAVFMFTGFIKGIPLEIEEAAMIDGCNPIQIYFRIMMPILKPTVITIAILNAMWIWNDYLLPYLVIGISTKYKTIPVVVQYLKGTYGAIDYGSFMSMLVLAIIPVVIFYAVCQKYIIQGVLSGAVKG